MKTKVTWLIFIVLNIPVCANSTNSYPRMECKLKLIPEHAVLCSKTVAINFGPADQLMGYSIVQGQVLCVLRRDIAESMFSTEINHKKTFIKDIDELVSNDNVTSYKSGSIGENILTIDAGSYIICTQSKREVSMDQPILSCEPADLKMDHKYKLIIIDNPRAGIQFEWN